MISDIVHILYFLISLYKIAKFFATSSDSIRYQIQDICNHWNFSESVLINNEKRRVWKEEQLEKLELFCDALGYIVLFNRSVQSKRIGPASQQDYVSSLYHDDFLDRNTD